MGALQNEDAEQRRPARRRRQVEAHVARENAHDLAGIMATFGERARYEDTPWGEVHEGHQAVADYYHGLLAALPDLSITIEAMHTTRDCVVLETRIRGHHRGWWRGVPPTGRALDFALCAVFAFDSQDRLAGERIYYDRLAVMAQLGLFQEPERPLGRLRLAVNHPLVLGAALARTLFSARRRVR